jgi:hypothetical protein
MKRTVRPRRLYALILWCLLTAGSATAGLFGRRPISTLTQSADAIVVGSASGTLPVGLPGAFALEVIRVVKGPAVLAGSTIQVNWTFPRGGLIVAGGDGVAATGTGIWFLKSAAGGWSFLPVTWGSVTFDMTYFPAPMTSLPGVYAYSATAPVQDKVASELAAAIEAWDGSFKPQFDDLLRGDLENLKSPVIRTLDERLAASSSARQQILGLDELIIGGDASALAKAVASDASFSKYGQERGKLLFAIRELFRSTDPAAIATLGQTAESTSAALDLRRVAAHALAAIHTTAALPYLATLLDDPDSILRVEGIGGIGAFANSLPMQTPADTASLAYLQFPASGPYKTEDTMAHFVMGPKAIGSNESFYLSFWKAWWQQNRASLGF